jgi:hypothetical protein
MGIFADGASEGEAYASLDDVVHPTCDHDGYASFISAIWVEKVRTTSYVEMFSMVGL